MSPQMPAHSTPITPESSPDSPPEENWRINPYYLLGFMGTSTYAAWLFLQYINPLFALDKGFASTGGISPHLLFVSVAVLALIVTWLLADRLSTRRGIGLLSAFALLFSPLSSLTPYLDIIPGADGICWALSALGYASLMLLWSTLLVTLKGSQVPVYVAATVMAGAAVYVFVVSVIGPLTFLLSATMPLLSTLFFLASFRLRSSVVSEAESTLHVTAADSDEKDPVDWKLVVDTMTYTPCLGIGIYCALNFMDYPTNIICVGVAAVFSCAVVVVDFTRTRLLSSKMQLKLFLPLAAATVFPLSFVTGLALNIFVFAVFLVFMLSLVTNYAAISECSRVFELNPIRFFSYGRAYTIFGVLIGYLFASFAFGDFIVSHGLTILVFAGIMFAFIIAATFILEDHYPISTEVADDLDTAVATPAKTLDYWDERCMVIARNYGLSARQTEVLKLLAKGRNTGYIQKHLVISPYTAKAHIYNIYQKIGIHSRQELLDRFEEVELD